jgi:hypothetical protein
MYAFLPRCCLPLVGGFPEDVVEVEVNEVVDRGLLLLGET